MPSIWCAQCGAEDPEYPCSCGSMETTESEPSFLPCHYCGNTPTWMVEWDTGNGPETLWLCGYCDKMEIDFLNEG